MPLSQSLYPRNRFARDGQWLSRRTRRGRPRSLVVIRVCSDTPRRAAFASVMAGSPEEVSLVEMYAQVCARECVPDAIKNSTLCKPDDLECQCRPENVQAIDVKARECLQQQCGAIVSKGGTSSVSCAPWLLPFLAHPWLLALFSTPRVDVELTLVSTVITAQRARQCSNVRNGIVPSSSSVSTAQPTSTTAAPTATGVPTISSAPAASSKAFESEGASASTDMALAIAFGSIMGLMILSAAALGCICLRRRRRQRRTMGKENFIHLSGSESRDGEATAATATGHGSSGPLWLPPTAPSAYQPARLPSTTSTLSRPPTHPAPATGQADPEHLHEVHGQDARVEALGDTQRAQDGPGMYELPCEDRSLERRRRL